MFTKQITHRYFEKCLRAKENPLLNRFGSIPFSIVFQLAIPIPNIFAIFAFDNP